MPRGKSDTSTEILEYALLHLERERDAMQQRIDAIRSQLGAKPGKSTPKPQAVAAEASEARPRRVMSEAARRRIAAAQKKRWAEHRKQAAAAQ